MLRMFQGLPSYFGGKRRLLGAIFKFLPPPTVAPTFVDPFLGGGAVSLYAKARGHRVVCNDTADRSFVVGKALIENDSAPLNHSDLVGLGKPRDEPGYAETNLAPDVFPLDHARYLDRCLANSRELEGPKRSLGELTVIKYALRMRPNGNFGAKTIIRQAMAGEWEAMNSAYARDLNARGLRRHPIRVADLIRKQINGGIFSNGRDNEAHNMDVFEFLSKVEGDVAYFDPPYSGTQSYERSLRPLDDLLRGRAEIPSPSLFTTDPPEQILPRLFEAAEHISTWVLSYGNQCIDLEGLIALMKRYRPHVEGRAIAYVHCTSLASEGSRRRNQELIVVGRK